MQRALEHFFPSRFQWSRPEGGMFLWVQGPQGMDMELVYQVAVAQRVAFVPGTFFFTQPGRGKETMRLNFSMADESTLTKAIEVLGKILYGFMPGSSK
jgi:2-aminoadipate transaminase